jgi:hypothetical protein
MHVCSHLFLKDNSCKLAAKEKEEQDILTTDAEQVS